MAQAEQTRQANDNAQATSVAENNSNSGAMATTMAQMATRIAQGDPNSNAMATTMAQMATQMARQDPNGTPQPYPTQIPYPTQNPYPTQRPYPTVAVTPRGTPSQTDPDSGFGGYGGGTGDTDYAPGTCSGNLVSSCDGMIANYIFTDEQQSEIELATLPEDWLDVGGYIFWMASKLWLWVARPLLCGMWYIYQQIWYYLLMPVWDFFRLLIYAVKILWQTFLAITWPVTWVWSFITNLIPGLISLILYPAPVAQANLGSFSQGFAFVQNKINATPLAALPVIFIGIAWLFTIRWALTQFTRLNE